VLRRESPVFAAPFYPVPHDKEPRGGPINKIVANREGYIPFAWPRRWPLTVRWSDQLGGHRVTHRVPADTRLEGAPASVAASLAGVRGCFRYGSAKVLPLV
jgi:hypothetical protein